MSREQLAIARAAIDASEFARAREVLAPYVNEPTQRVALLMAELERTEHGDGGRARAWTLRAVRARHDPAWTADGYVSDRWRPVSPVTGRLDAFQWQTPVASLPSDKGTTIEVLGLRGSHARGPAAEAGDRGQRGAGGTGRDRAGRARAQQPAGPCPAAQDNAPPAPRKNRW